MSKRYVIEINDGEDNICINGQTDRSYYTRVVLIDDLEELTAEYVNKHFRMRGIKDHAEGVTSCEFCRYEGVREEDEPCCNCSHSHLDMFAPKVKDEKIEVGDEVNWCNEDTIVVTMVYADGGFNWCDGVSKDGRAYHMLQENVRKTGKHYAIKAILEDMQE